MSSPPGGGADAAPAPEPDEPGAGEEEGPGVHPFTPQGDEVAIYDAEEAAQIMEMIEKEEAEVSMIKAIVGTVFSTRKPRDVVAGTSSGLKTVARGVGLGLASLVAQPYIGAKQGGAKGFVKGVGAGLATCTASTVGGALVGTGQIVRGVVNTPGAIRSKARGQVWDSEKRQWKEDWYSLPEEAAEVFGSEEGADDAEAGAGAGGAGASSSSASRRPKKKVVDRSLYDVLDVPPEATDSEIRKAFYKKSLALHPDKNPDNPEATAKFQAVSDAYRILGDEERRRAYDEHGKDSAAAGLPKIEPAVFFAALFGSHHFEPFIGRLRLAQEIDGDLQSLLRDAVAGGEEEEPNIDVLKLSRAQKKMKVVERQRQVQCALDLVKRLEPVVMCADTEREQAFQKWEEEHRELAQKLAQTACGPETLFTIGWVYTNRSRQFFAGGVLRRVLAKVEGKVHMAQTKAKLAGAVGTTAYKVNSVMKNVEKKKSLKEKAEPAKATQGGEAAADAAGSAASAGSSSGAAAAAASGAGAAAAKEPPAAPEAGDAPARRSSAPAGVGESAGSAATRDPSPPRSEVSFTPTENMASDLPPGTLVILRGLQSAAELNNEVGMVVGYDPDACRFLVQVLPDIGLKKLKRENLTVLEAAEPQQSEGGASGSTAPPPFQGGEDGQWAPGGEEAEMADAFKDCMPLFHDSLWNVTALDIEYTLGSVIQKVLRDMSVDKGVRKRRAEALLRLGTILQEPMRERNRKAKEALALEAPPPSTAPNKPVPESPTSQASQASKRSSMLMRFKPRWRTSSEQKKTQKAKACEAKQKRMEAALAMMAAGASTEDVDDMAAARAAMEEEDAEAYGF